MTYDDGIENTEQHPSFGMITAQMASLGGERAHLFDSEVNHGRVIEVTIANVKRQRGLNRDWILPVNEPDLITVWMTPSQWGAFVASGSGQGSPCTVKRVGKERIPDPKFKPRTEISIAEIERAAEATYARVVAALERVEERPTKERVRALRHAVDGAKGNLVYQANTFTEHVERVTDKARADLAALLSMQGEPAVLPEKTEGDER